MIHPALWSAALVAGLVGFGGTVSLVLAAATAVGATMPQTASWLFAVCLATAAGSAVLSTGNRMPMVLAWSTPGAALIAGSTGVSMAQAAGAFLCAAGLIVVTGLVPPLGRLIAKLPAAIAAGMLAGVLLPFCLAVPLQVERAPALMLPVVAVFIAVRMWNPALAVLAALATGLVLTAAGPGGLPAAPFALPALVVVAPQFDPAVLVSLALPLYLVTMASQNLPGFAVLQGAGYAPPVPQALMVTGAVSAAAALFGGHTVSMAAITAAICLDDGVHPAPAQRWKVGLAYAVVWASLGAFGTVILAAIAQVPPALIAGIAGLALIAPLINAVSSAFAAPAMRFTAAVTLIVAASGVAAFGIGAAFWGLVAGLAVAALHR